MSDEETAFEFPCTFPLKVMGSHDEAFEAEVLALVRDHVGEPGEEAVERRTSRNGRYLSLTVTFTATSKDQLDGLYRALHASDKVLMTL
ncbi:MAG: YbeD family protein [Pseudomonadota bacterium]